MVKDGLFLSASGGITDSSCPTAGTEVTKGHR